MKTGQTVGGILANNMILNFENGILVEWGYISAPGSGGNTGNNWYINMTDLVDLVPIEIGSDNAVLKTGLEVHVGNTVRITASGYYTMKEIYAYPSYNLIDPYNIHARYTKTGYTPPAPLWTDPIGSFTEYDDVLYTRSNIVPDVYFADGSNGYSFTDDTVPSPTLDVINNKYTWECTFTEIHNLDGSSSPPLLFFNFTDTYFSWVNVDWIYTGYLNINVEII